MSDETVLYENMLLKINKIKDNIENIKNYSNNDRNKDIKYIKKLEKFSRKLNKIYSISEDLNDLNIISIDENILTNEDLEKQKSLKINKTVYDTFFPYMLYLQVLLQNNLE